jgi:hypothetical protein
MIYQPSHRQPHRHAILIDGYAPVPGVLSI